MDDQYLPGGSSLLCTRCGVELNVKLEDLKPAGSRVAAVRCRVDDAIRFQKSCRWVLTYENDPGAAKALGSCNPEKWWFAGTLEKR